MIEETERQEDTEEADINELQDETKGQVIEEESTKNAETDENGFVIVGEVLTDYTGEGVM